jgi:hypothetical protein
LKLKRIETQQAHQQTHAILPILPDARAEDAFCIQIGVRHDSEEKNNKYTFLRRRPRGNCVTLTSSQYPSPLYLYTLFVREKICNARWFTSSVPIMKTNTANIIFALHATE